MPADSEQSSGPGLLVLLVLGYLAFQFFGSDPVSPDPEPSPAIVSELSTAVSQFGSLSERHIRGTIAKLEAGDLTTDRDTRDWLAAGQSAAQRAAFEPVASRDVTAFSGGWTVAKQIERLRGLVDVAE